MKYTNHLFIILILFFPSFSDSQINWVQTNGPFGGNATAVGINNNGDIYSYFEDSGVYLSQDTCETWMFLGKDSITSDLVSFSFNSSGEVFGNSDYSLYRLLNDGTWTNIIYIGIHDVEIDNNDYLYVGWDYGVARSLDNGNNWNGIATWSKVNSLASNDSGYLFIATQDSGIYRTDDAGATLQKLNNGLPANSIPFFSICTNPNNPGHVFAGTYDGLYFSQNNGNDWTFIYTNLFYINRILINSANHIFIFGAFYDIWGDVVYCIQKSTDYGISWHNIFGLPNQIPSSMFFSTSIIGLAATNKGIFISYNMLRNEIER